MLKEILDWRSFVDRGEIAEKWKPSGSPAFFIIDANGVIRKKWSGPPGEKAMDRALDEVIAEAINDEHGK